MSLLYYLLLLFILLVASVYDVKYLRIPNYITFPSMMLGILLGPLDKNTIIFKVFGWFILFFIGMFRLVGMGDLKLIMVIHCFLSFFPSLFCTGIAAGLLLVFCCIKKPKDTLNIFKITIYQLLLRNFQKIDEEGFPFAPFLFIGTGIYLLATKIM